MSKKYLSKHLARFVFVLLGDKNITFLLLNSTAEIQSTSFRPCLPKYRSNTSKKKRADVYELRAIVKPLFLPLPLLVNITTTPIYLVTQCGVAPVLDTLPPPPSQTNTQVSLQADRP